MAIRSFSFSHRVEPESVLVLPSGVNSQLMTVARSKRERVECQSQEDRLICCGTQSMAHRRLPKGAWVA